MPVGIRDRLTHGGAVRSDQQTVERTGFFQRTMHRFQ